MQDPVSQAGATPESIEVAQLLGMDEEFERVLESLLQHLRQSMAVPPGVADPVVEQEFSRARKRLRLFRTEYRTLYARAITRYLAAEELCDVIAGLSHAGTRRFRAVEVDIRREISQATATLSQRMIDTLLFEAPEAPSGGRE